MMGLFGNRLKILTGGAAVVGVVGVMSTLGDPIHANSYLTSHERFPASAHFPDVSQNNNYMAKVLTPELYNRLRTKVTPHGWTFDDCIQSGIDNPGEDAFILPVGCSVGDQESYEVFSEFFNKVIEKRHDGYNPELEVHESDLDYSKIEGGCCLDEDYVLSTRIRTGRNIAELNLPSACTRAERRQVEKVIVDALNNLTGEFRGRYYPLKNMNEEEQSKHIEDRFLFEKPTSPTLARDWPDSRGIWHNDAKTLLVWINTNDHARIMSMQKGGNISQVFHKYSKGVKAVEEELRKKGWRYMQTESLGYILTCPSNLGTGMRASVHIRVPLLCKDPKFDKFLNAYRLQKRQISGPHVEEGTIDISNADRLGKTEVQLVQTLVDGTTNMIKMEKELEDGGTIDSYIPKCVSKNVKKKWSLF